MGWEHGQGSEWGMPDAALGFLTGGGGMGERMRAHYWSAGPLGPAQAWPQSLKTAVSMMLNSRYAMFVAWGPELSFLYNDTYAVMMCDKHPRGLGRPFREVWPEIWGELTPLIESALDGEATGFEDMHLKMERHGYLEDTWFTFSYGPVVDESGRPGGMYCTANETTAKVKAEALRQSAEDALSLQLKTEAARMQDLFERATSFICLLRGPGHLFEMTNASYRRLIGGRDVIGLTLAEGLPELAGQGFIDLLDSVFSTGQPYVGTGTPVLLQTESEGELESRILDFVYQPVRAASGEVTGIFVEGVDVTEHVRATESLRIAQESGGVGTFECFPETGRVEASEQWRRLWGFAKDEEITAAEMLSRVIPEDLVFAGPNRLNDPNPLAYAEYRIRRPDGAVRWLARQGEVVAPTPHRPPRYLGMAFDITHRKTIEAELIQSQSQFKALVDTAPHHVWTAGPDGALDWFNPRVYHYAEAAEGSLDGAAWGAIVHPDDLPDAARTWAACVEAGSVYQVEFRLRNAAGDYRWFLARAAPILDGDGKVTRWIGTNTDIHDQKTLAAELEARVAERTADLVQTEEALRQAQKMEAVGQLTGGIAHDFNNLLQGITGSLDLIQRRIAQGRTAELNRFIAGAMGSANRAAALTHRLLAFSRRQPLDPRAVDANTLVASMEDLVQRTVGETISLKLLLARGLWPTLCDPNQLESALLNLVINARDAMPDGGTLVVSTSNVEFGKGGEPPRRDMKPGQYVCLSVADTGIGMSPDVIERAFDPFFTTKPTGQGTGLGLSMIYGFARQSEGYALIESEVGRGTTFCLYLPRHHGDAEADDAAGARAPAAGTDSGEVVLVVEDEPVVRALIVEVLTELGYQPLEAADGPSGLGILQSSRRIDLLITDVGLPGLNGRQVADAARAVRPNLKVLFMTGYAENAAAASGFLEPGMALIAKPFAMDDLAMRIREMMEA